jgi:L-seryl-tRNA(Ser) seleniumtransferase
MNAGNASLRRLPGIDHLLQLAAVKVWMDEHGRDLALAALREAQEATRAALLAGESCDDNLQAEVLARAEGALQRATLPTLRPVINATGVVLHTNLGRAPLSDATLAAMRAAGEGYSNLEFDLAAGQRGSRYVHAEALLCRLTGAEAALVVNNNAGAVLLTLSALAAGREVVISRGQLVEIGGGFRVPDVMAQSGARLVEVGATNRTYACDYETAIGAETAALMRVHASNFRISGFTAQPTLDELAALAHAHNLWLFDDLGSGTLLDTAPLGLAHEPTVQESVAACADIITFSGDKLLGGPQAGFILGRRELIERLRHFPLTRALRVDKTTLAGIQANLLHYLKGEALREAPIWRMLSLSAEELAERTKSFLVALGPQGLRCDLWPGLSMIGGGSLPGETLPTTLIALPPGDAQAQARALRGGDPPVVARIVEGRVVLDLRTVLPREAAALAERVRDVFQ